MSDLLNHANTLETDELIPEAIQVYEDVIRSDVESATRAIANYRLGYIYKEWGELFAAQRFLSQAHQLNPEHTGIREAIDSLNEHFSQNRDQIADQMSRQNSDQIVSLFRIATGIKLLAMDKPTQAYPLMKSRTKIFPNAAVARHLLTDISITEDERNSAIEFLIEKEWLITTGTELYTIADNGLYAFYTELTRLHIDNLAYTEAIACCNQAYWLDSSLLAPLFQKVICCAALEDWNQAASEITKLPSEIPSTIDPIAYWSAVAESCHHIYQKSGDETDKERIIDACEEVLRLDKKDKAISKLLAGYIERKSWWRKD